MKSEKMKMKLVRPAYLFAAAGVSCVICISALRSNYQHMTQLRAAVYTADKDDQNVSAALTDLQHYVVSHMNTDLTPGNSSVYPPIQLKYTYERLQAAGSDAATANNEQVYSDAQVYCEQQNSSDFSGKNRVPCIQDYVKAHYATIPQTVPDSLYKFDFVSPSWSPDLAGWSLLTTAGLILAAIITAIVSIVRRPAKRP